VLSFSGTRVWNSWPLTLPLEPCPVLNLNITGTLRKDGEEKGRQEGR
jgi:hypothetical protein